MGQSSEQYIELCDEWVNMNYITGLPAITAYEKAYGCRDYEFGGYSTPNVIKRSVKKEDFKVWE